MSFPPPISGLPPPVTGVPAPLPGSLLPPPPSAASLPPPPSLSNLPPPPAAIAPPPAALPPAALTASMPPPTAMPPPAFSAPPPAAAPPPSKTAPRKSPRLPAMPPPGKAPPSVKPPTAAMPPSAMPPPAAVPPPMSAPPRSAPLRAGEEGDMDPAELRRLEEERLRVEAERAKAAAFLQTVFRLWIQRKAYKELYKQRSWTLHKAPVNVVKNHVTKGRPRGPARSRGRPTRGHHKRVVTKEVVEPPPPEEGEERDSTPSKARVLNMGGPAVALFDPSKVALKSSSERRKSVTAEDLVSSSPSFLDSPVLRRRSGTVAASSRMCMTPSTGRLERPKNVVPLVETNEEKEPPVPEFLQDRRRSKTMSTARVKVAIPPALAQIHAPPPIAGASSSAPPPLNASHSDGAFPAPSTLPTPLSPTKKSSSGSALPLPDFPTTPASPTGPAAFPPPPLSPTTTTGAGGLPPPLVATPSTSEPAKEKKKKALARFFNGKRATRDELVQKGILSESDFQELSGMKFGSGASIDDEEEEEAVATPTKGGKHMRPTPSKGKTCSAAKCGKKLGMTNKVHCKNCGLVFCKNCLTKKFKLTSRGYTKPVPVCTKCYFQIQSDMMS